MALFQIYVYIHIYGTGLLPVVLALETGETSEMARLADPQDRRRGLSLQHQSHNKGHRYVPTRMVQIQTPTTPNAGAEPQGRSYGPGGSDAEWHGPRGRQPGSFSRSSTCRAARPSSHAPCCSATGGEIACLHQRPFTDAHGRFIHSRHNSAATTISKTTR